MRIDIRKLLGIHPEKWIAVDVELDGNHPSHIIQLSYLIIRGRKVIGKNFYFAAQRINPYARRVHHLGTYELRKLSGGDTFAMHADEIFRDFDGCTRVIGHDVSGDVHYIQQEFSRAGIKAPDFPQFCTMKHYRMEVNIPLKENPNVIKNPNLEEVCRHFGLTPAFIAGKSVEYFGDGKRPHDARYDATAAYLCMMIGENLA